MCIQDSGKTSTGAYETEKLAATVEEKKLDVEEMRILCWMCSIPMLERMRNGGMNGTMEVGEGSLGMEVVGVGR